MKFKTANAFEGNQGRAARLGFREAPQLKGYFFAYKDCLENLHTNLERTARGEPPVFKLAFIETADRCNLRCPMCYTDACGMTGKARLDFLEAKVAIEAARLLGVQTIAIAGHGEPLLDREFFRIANLVRENGMGLVAFLNGTLIDRNTALCLKKECDVVVTKLFALDGRTNDALVGVKGAHVKMKRGLDNLLDAGFEAPFLGADVVINKMNKDGLEGMLCMCRQANIVPYFERMWPLGRGEQKNANIFLDNGEVDEIFRNLRKVDEEKFGITWDIVPGMGVLGNAETDKRMIAFHLDVFGGVHAGLGAGCQIGNIRTHPRGIHGILNEVHEWQDVFRKIAGEVGLEEMDAAAAIALNEKIGAMKKVALEAALGMANGPKNVYVHEEQGLNGGFKVMDFNFWTTEVNGAVAKDGTYAVLLRLVHEPVGEACVNFHLKLFKVLPDGETALLRQYACLNDFAGKRIIAVGGEGIAVEFFGERVVI